MQTVKWSMKAKPPTRKPSATSKSPLNPSAMKRGEAAVKLRPTGLGLEKIIHIIPAPALLSEMEEGRCLHFNKRCLSLFDLSRREISGRSVYELISPGKP